jgi:hypothetical protein
MKDLDQYLVGLMDQVCTDLARMYPSERQPSEYGLIFPSKRDGTLRIGEQEAKLLFVQYLTVDRRYCFSVETPTGEDVPAERQDADECPRRLDHFRI